jgi:hypothetical protein
MSSVAALSIGGRAYSSPMRDMVSKWHRKAKDMSDAEYLEHMAQLDARNLHGDFDRAWGALRKECPALPETMR